MKLSGLVCPDAITVNLQSCQRNNAIEELVDLLVKAGKVDASNREAILKAVIARENEASTGIGKGVAVPHVKTPLANEPVGAYGLSLSGIDFSSLDKQPVYSIFLIIGPDNTPEVHLSAMELVFKNLQKEDFRSFLRQAKSVDDIVTLLEEVDRDEI